MFRNSSQQQATKLLSYKQCCHGLMRSHTSRDMLGSDVLPGIVGVYADLQDRLRWGLCMSSFKW